MIQKIKKLAPPIVALITGGITFKFLKDAEVDEKAIIVGSALSGGIAGAVTEIAVNSIGINEQLDTEEEVPIGFTPQDDFEDYEGDDEDEETDHALVDDVSESRGVTDEDESVRFAEEFLEAVMRDDFALPQLIDRLEQLITADARQATETETDEEYVESVLEEYYDSTPSESDDDASTISATDPVQDAAADIPADNPEKEKRRARRNNNKKDDGETRLEHRFI